jgi:protein-disulfide isomerase
LAALFVAGGIVGGLIGTRSAQHLSARRAEHCVRRRHYCGGALYAGAYFVSILRIEPTRRTEMTKSTDPVRLSQAPSRRETLGALGAGALVLGLQIAPGSAWAQSDDDNVLTEALVLRDPDIPVAGNANGDVSIVEYFDYQCPYCRKLEPELRQVVQDDGKVRLVLKDWPILGPVSVTAARMALASKFQDKFLQAHEALIGVNSKLTEPRIRELLAGAGIDVDRATRDLATHAEAIDAILARNNDQATAFGFKGTPSFIVGKFRVPGVLTMAEFDQVIADARKAAARK